MNEHYQDLIIGAGPAGLQLGYFFERAGRDYLILEAGDSAGTFFKTKPRHRRLISINKIHTGYDDEEINLRWDWNSLLGDETAPRFRDYSRRYFPSADALVDYLGDFADHYGLAIRYGSRVETVDRPEQGGPFELTLADGTRVGADRLHVATGVNRLYQPAIPGLELAETYESAPTDADDYTGQDVLILGKGNSGFETANHLVETAAIIHVASPEPIKMAWKTHHVGHLRALNNDFLDTYQLKCQNAVLDCTVESIEVRDDGKFAVSVSYTHASGEREVLLYDRVINCTGYRLEHEIFSPRVQPELIIDSRLPALTPTWESVNVDNLYFIGTLMQSCDFKKTTSSFIHGFRYNIRTHHRLLEERLHGVAYPSRAVEWSVEALTDAALARINRSSALWQQFGYLGDVIALDPESGEGRYLEELPMQWLPDSPWARGTCFSVTLEFGPHQSDPFAIERKPSPEHARDSAFLHPVVRRWVGGEPVAVVHLLENLYGEWHGEAEHREPLLAFFHESLAGAGSVLAEAV